MLSSLPPFYAIIPAAGTGSRTGLTYSKMLFEIQGKTVLERTISKVLSCVAIQKIIVPCRKEDLSILKNNNPAQDKIIFIEGGKVRRESVFQALQKIEKFAPDVAHSYVLIHDGARCFVTVSLLERSVQAVLKYQAVTSALPLSDSIKEVSNAGLVVRSVSRHGLWTVQTPQVFRLDLIIKAHQNNNLAVTDDAELVEAVHPVQVIEGERSNIKITSKEDLEWVARMGEQHRV